MVTIMAENILNSDRKKCILFCAGEFKPECYRVEDIKNQIDEETLVVAVDGGLTICRLLNIYPDMIIGDFDSASDDDKLFIEKSIDIQIVKLPKEKDDTDTIAAVRRALEYGCKEFLLYGAAGGRIDHYFANIQTLLLIKHNGANGIIKADDSELFVIENESVTLTKRDKGTVSLLVLGDRAEEVSIQGLYYEVDKVLLTNDFPIGVSNEFCGKEATISVQNGALLCVVLREY